MAALDTHSGPSVCPQIRLPNHRVLNGAFLQVGWSRTSVEVRLGTVHDLALHS